MANQSVAAILIATKLPDLPAAEQLARRLIAQQLAACVNIMPPCTSVYRWQGGLEMATEVPLQIKSTLARYAAIEAVIRQLHPYELPEISYVHLDGGEAAYIQWIQQETQA